MARPLLQLADVTLTFGGDPLLNCVDLVVQPGERMALVGRNGSGKSTLMKVMAGRVDFDSGNRVVAPGNAVRYMDQDPTFDGFATLGDFALQDLGPSESYRIETIAQGLSFDPEGDAKTASGGEKRRAALARLLADEPDLMLLDEPTNHLDISAIAWAENYLKSTNSAFIIISHDRAFLRELSRTTLWLDRGILRRADQPFDRFEDWRDKIWAEEDLDRHKLNRKIKAEARWAVEGISARRKRNQGRVRALQDLRSQRANQIRRQGTADMAFEAGQKSGKLVLEATDISKSYNDTKIIDTMSLRIMRGDRIALVGPNGVGKTTLLKILTKEIAPDTGTVRHGSNLVPAVFDQSRSALDPNATLWESLTNDPTMAVSGRSDQIMVRGTPRHVVGYLKDFLFDESQARAPVRSLSGGEKARLLLAKLMAQEANLLILDEPTNDLDVETLDLLQDILGEFPGTVLIVSHDRDFLDRTATMTLGFEGRGKITVHAGGWTEYQASKPSAVSKKPKQKTEPKAVQKIKQSGLTFTEKHRLEALPDGIDRLTAEISKLEEYLATPNLFNESPVKFAKASEALAERMSSLSSAETEWLELEEKSEPHD